MTTTRTSSSAASARRSVRRPSASIPSSLVSRTLRIALPRILSALTRSVGDAREVEPVRCERRPGGRARSPLEQLDERVEAAAAAGHLEHRADQRAVHLAHEAVGLDPELEQLAALLPASGEHVAVEAHVVGL